MTGIDDEILGYVAQKAYWKDSGCESEQHWDTLDRASQEDWIRVGKAIVELIKNTEKK